MYIETISNSHSHERVFVSFEQTVIIQFISITFFYIRFSILKMQLKTQWVGFEFSSY